jgi:amidase
MSVPLHRTDAGLPVGVHFIGNYAKENILIRLAAQLEAARPWARLIPPITSQLLASVNPALASAGVA